MIAAVTPLEEGLVVTAVVVAVAAVVWALLTRAGHRFVGRIEARREEEGTIVAGERAQRTKTLWSMLRMFLFVVMTVSVVLVLLSVWGVPTGPLIAVGSVLGIAVGFGAQDFIRDVIAGVLIVAEGQYSIGDTVRIAGVEGEVEAIRLRTTVLRQADGNLHHVPNGQIEVTTNLTQEFSQVIVDLGVSYDTDLDRVMAVVADEMAAFADDPGWRRRFLAEPELLGVEELAAWAIKLRVVLRVEPDARLDTKREFLRRIKARFDREGIVIPSPHGLAPTVPPEEEKFDA